MRIGTKAVLAGALLMSTSWTISASAADSTGVSSLCLRIAQESQLSSSPAVTRVALLLELSQFPQDRLQSPVGDFSAELGAAYASISNLAIIPEDSSNVVLSQLFMDSKLVMANSVRRDEFLSNVGADAFLLVRLKNQEAELSAEWCSARSKGELSETKSLTLCKVPDLRRWIGEAANEGQLQVAWYKGVRVELKGPCDWVWSQQTNYSGGAKQFRVLAGTYRATASATGFESKTEVIQVPSGGSKSLTAYRFDNPASWLKSPILAGALPGAELGFYGNRMNGGGKAIALLSALATYSGIAYELLSAQGVFARSPKLSRLEGSVETRSQIRLATRIAYGANIGCGLALGLAHDQRYLSLRVN